jgi:hypothetical protein
LLDFIYCLWVDQLESWVLAVAAAGGGNPARLVPAVRDTFDTWLVSPLEPSRPATDLDRLHEWLGVA